MELYDEQRRAAERILNEPTRAALVAAETGWGKTLVALDVVKQSGKQVVLLVAPIKTKKQWQNQAQGQGVDLDFKVIDSKNLHNFEHLRSGVPGLYFVGREFFALSGTAGAGRQARWTWTKVKPDIAIYDEIHAVSNRWSKGFEALRQLNAGLKIAMSATPQGNKFKGIWPVCRWLWPDARNAQGELYVDTSQWRWAARWAKVEFDPYAGKKITDERVPGAFVNSLPCYIRHEYEKVPYIDYHVRCTLTDSQRTLYDKMERDALVWLGENPLVADIPIVQKTRLRQIALGEVSFDENGEIGFADDCESSKIAACHKIIERHPGEPILFLTDSQRFARVLAKRLPDAREYSGKVSHTERERLRTTFGTEYQYLVAVIAAVAEGLDGLQERCSTEVWVNTSYDLVKVEQARGRLNRRGQKAERITRYELIAPGTADDDHFENMVRQALVQRETLKERA